MVRLVVSVQFVIPSPRVALVPVFSLDRASRGSSVVPSHFPGVLPIPLPFFMVV